MFASIYVGGKKKIERVAMFSQVDEDCGNDRLMIAEMGETLALRHGKKDYHIFWHYNVEEMNMLPVVMTRKVWRF